MKKQTIYALLISTIFVLSYSPTLAQEHPDEYSANPYHLNYRAFRASLVPGLSTNGINAVDYASRYSLNILAGYNGALENGFELGGIINANKYYAHGLQIAGIGNYSGSETAGLQFAGVFNYTGQNMEGIQLTNIVNASEQNMEGLQFSGVLNWAGGNTEGIQASGIANVSRGNMQGLFFSGVGNISTNDMEGISFSGVVNISGGDMHGLMASGLINYSKTFQGIALSPVNVSGDARGIQVGNVNVADHMLGIQIGLINYAREMNGMPVGLISYYDNGRKNFDLWTSDTGFTNFGIKLGTNEFYNMISVGYNPYLDSDVWQLGWSIGRLHEYHQYFFFTDFSYFKINEGGWTKDLNSIFKYRLLFGQELSGGLKLYGGPTFNLLISRVPESRNYTWYRIFDFGAKGRSYIFWIGYSLGIQLF